MEEMKISRVGRPKKEQKRDIKIKVSREIETETQSIEYEIPDELREDVYTGVFPIKHSLGAQGGFITLFQQAMLNISLYANLTKNEMQILLFILGTAGLNNSILVDLNILCDKLKLKKPNVQKALKGLTDRNIVIKVNQAREWQQPLPMELHINYDQINYNLAYNGKVKEYKEKKSVHPEIITDELQLLEARRKKTPMEMSINFDSPEEPILTPYFGDIETFENDKPKPNKKQ